MNDLKKCLQHGIFYGYHELRELLDRGDFHLKIAEYLFTVKVAQYLLDWVKEERRRSKKRFSVILEYNAGWFYENAFETGIEKINPKTSGIKTAPLPGNFIRKKGVGRIDIAITRSVPRLPSFLTKDRHRERSIYGVEIKGINPTKSKLQEDFKRLSMCLLATYDNHENSIEECFILYARRLDKPQDFFSENDRPVEEYLKLKELSLFSECSYFGLLEVEVCPFDIYTRLIEDVINDTPSDHRDEGFDPLDTGSVWGMLIAFRKSNLHLLP